MDAFIGEPEPGSPQRSETRGSNTMSQEVALSWCDLAEEVA